MTEKETLILGGVAMLALAENMRENGEQYITPDQLERLANKQIAMANEL